jgi:hypothetical protein
MMSLQQQLRQQLLGDTGVNSCSMCSCSSCRCLAGKVGLAVHTELSVVSLVAVAVAAGQHVH